jgi:hypothetical protein
MGEPHREISPTRTFLQRALPNCLASAAQLQKKLGGADEIRSGRDIPDEADPLTCTFF